MANPHGLRGLIDYVYEREPGKWKCERDRYSIIPLFRHHAITRLCLEGLVTEEALYSKEQIDKMLSDPTDYLRAGRTRQQLEARTFKWLNTRPCVGLSKLPNLRTVGLRMRVGQEMDHVNFMYGVSAMRRGLVEFVDQSHWLIRTQNPNDIWRIQYACFTLADYATDKNMERISDDKRRLEEEVTDIDSRAPGLQEGDERYVEVQIQRIKRDNDVGTVSEVSDANTEDILHVQANLRLESSDLSPTQVGELQDTPEPAHGEVEIEPEEPFMEVEDDLEYQGIQLPAHDGVEIELYVPPIELDDELQILPLDNDLSGTESEPEVLNTAEPFVRSQSQDDYDPQSNEHSDEKNDHALSQAASHDVFSIPSTESSRQQAAESLMPTYSKIVRHPIPTNTDSSRKFQTDSDDEDSNFHDESRLGDQVAESTENEETKAERHRRIRKRLLRQAQQPLSPFSNIPYPDTAEGMGSFYEWQEPADLGVNQQTETGVRESTQSSTREMREHGIKNPGATSQKATNIEKQQLMAIPGWLWSLFVVVQIWTILLTYCYSCLLVIFLTASWKNMHGN